MSRLLPDDGSSHLTDAELHSKTDGMDAMISATRSSERIKGSREQYLREAAMREVMLLEQQDTNDDDSDDESITTDIAGLDFHSMTTSFLSYLGDKENQSSSLGSCLDRGCCGEQKFVIHHPENDRDDNDDNDDENNHVQQSARFTGAPLSTTQL